MFTKNTSRWNDCWSGLWYHMHDKYERKIRHMHNPLTNIYHNITLLILIILIILTLYDHAQLVRVDQRQQRVHRTKGVPEAVVYSKYKITDSIKQIKKSCKIQSMCNQKRIKTNQPQWLQKSIFATHNIYIRHYTYIYYFILYQRPAPTTIQFSNSNSTVYHNKT